MASDELDNVATPFRRPFGLDCQSSFCGFEDPLEASVHNEPAPTSLDKFEKFTITPATPVETIKAQINHIIRESASSSLLQLTELLQTITLNTNNLTLAHTHALIDLCGSEASRFLKDVDHRTSSTPDRSSCIASQAQDIIAMSLDYIHRVAEVKSLCESYEEFSDHDQVDDYKIKTGLYCDTNALQQTLPCKHLVLAQSRQTSTRTVSDDTGVGLISSDRSVLHLSRHLGSHPDVCTPQGILYKLSIAAQAKFEALKIDILERDSQHEFSGCVRGRPSREDILLKSSVSSSRAPVSNPSPGKPLDDSHYAAIDAAMSNRLAIIWGPPGTGKTRVLLEIVCRLMLSVEGCTVLVTAPRAHSVDDLLERFLAQGLHEIMTIAPIRAITDECRVFSDKSVLSINILSENDIYFKRRVSESRLVFSTCVAAGLGLLKQKIFDVVLVDEAAWQTEFETLIPLSKASQRIILAGDHKQFTGTVKRCDDIRDRYVTSLFEKKLDLQGLRPDGTATTMLRFQYSMHPELCDFVASEFYEDKLEPARSRNDLGPFSSCVRFAGAHERYFFVQYSDDAIYSQGSKSNVRLASTCTKVCSLFTYREPGPCPDMGHLKFSPNELMNPISIAIFTLYDEHVEDLCKQIPEHSVSTLNSYQGSTVDVVVFVITSRDIIHDQEVLEDMRALNVAITFAKEAFVVVGDCAMVMAEAKSNVNGGRATWRRLLQRSTDLSRKVEETNA